MEIILRKKPIKFVLVFSDGMPLVLTYEYSSTVYEEGPSVWNKFSSIGGFYNDYYLFKRANRVKFYKYAGLDNCLPKVAIIYRWV